MIQMNPEDVIGRPMSAFCVTAPGLFESCTGEKIVIDADCIAKDIEKMGEFYSLGISTGWKKYFLRSDNKVVPVEQNAAFIRNEAGERTDWVSIIRDITDRHEAEMRFEAANRDLADINQQLEQSIGRANEMACLAEMANIAKSEFLANMSHEIRTPLNGIIGFTDLLQDSNLDIEQRDYLHTIKDSGEMLLTIINDILDFSKIEAGHIELEHIEFDPEVLAYNVCDMIRPRISSKPIELMCNISDNIPSELTGDPHRTRQVLVNLMGNASKFTETGEIELSLDVEHQMGMLSHCMQQCAIPASVFLKKVCRQFLMLFSRLTDPPRVNTGAPDWGLLSVKKFPT